MADEVKLIDAELLTTNIAQIAKNCARSDAQKALIRRNGDALIFPRYCPECGADTKREVK